jgi:transcriptional regulator with XRE-family HTH domain
MMKTAQELMREIGQRSKERRLELNLTRQGLGLRSGVSMSVIRQFEDCGKISLESLLKIAIALGAAGEIDQLFRSRDSRAVVSMDDLLKQAKTRKRGRLT